MEAALNLLREQMLAVRDVRAAILGDEDLRRTDPGHRAELLQQTRRELAQLARAIDVLDRIERGELVEIEAPVGTLPPIRPRADPPPRMMALRPASPPEPRPIGPVTAGHGGRGLEFRGTV